MYVDPHRNNNAGNLRWLMAYCKPGLPRAAGGIMSRMTSDTDAIRHLLASMNSMVEENIEGHRVVKAFVREDYETRKFDGRNDAYMERNMGMARNTRRYMPCLDGLGCSLQLIAHRLITVE